MKETWLVKTGNCKIDSIWLSKEWIKDSENLLKIILMIGILKRRRKRIGTTVNQIHLRLDLSVTLIQAFHSQINNSHQCSLLIQCTFLLEFNQDFMETEHLLKISICLILYLIWAIPQLLLQKQVISNTQLTIKEELKMKSTTKMWICNSKKSLERTFKEEIF